MKRKRTYRAKKTVQNDVASETIKPLRKPVFDENITSMETETPTSGTVVRGNHRNLEIERNDNGSMEINTNALNHMIATIIKEISNEAGGMASLSRSNSISNGQMGHSNVNMELQENKSRLHYDPEYKKLELNASLAVIKKIMKLDAADPFNRPVDPVAFGIPDYFDVIDTPMDFATICNNIENGFKYLNSADVFKDVQYIWHNCVRYNKKGDRILELMKRVKIHFMKYWIAAGLDTEHANVESSILNHNKEQKDYPLTPLANNFTQLQQREPGSNQIVENRSGPSYMQAGQPQQSSSQPESSPERYEINIATPDSTITQKKVRGPTRGAKLLSTEGRITIVTNELGQPVGPEATKLTIFLGLTARDGNLAPLTYPSWSKMPKENKENMWQKVLTKFDIDPSCRKWVLMSLSSKWRNFKFYLKASHYDTHTTDEDRLADCDDRVLPDQWPFLVSQWSSKEWQSLSAGNKAKRAMVKFNHTTGTKSSASVLEEEVLFCDMESNSSSDSSGHEEGSKQRGPTIKSKSNKGKLNVSYNKKGVPIGDEATKLATFEGMVARTMVPITYETWRDVEKEKKEELWQYVLANFVLDRCSRNYTLMSIGSKWKNFKHYLYKNHIKPFKDNPEANLLKPPDAYPFVKKEDWKLFVAQRLSKKWEAKSKNGTKIRGHHTYNHRLSRKGYAGLTVEIMQETGMTEEEIDRVLLWKKAREKKSGGFDPNVQAIVERMEDMQNSGSLGEVHTRGTNDVLTLALGTQEQRGRVRGMGKYVRPHQYFYLPKTVKTVKEYFENENKKLDKRFNKIEGEIEKLKRGVNNAYEDTSCQVWDKEDFEDKPLEELRDTSCYLAVNVPSNIVAKGSIMNHSLSEGNIEVLMETFVQGEALLPIPPKEEFIMKVQDAVGHVLSWPRHLVLRCSDLDKVMTLMGKKEKVVKEKELDSKRKRQREPDKKEEDKKEEEKKNGKDKEVDKKEEEKKNGKDKETGEVIKRRRRTRAQMGTRLRVESNRVLRMCARLVDRKLTKVEAVRVQCEDDMFAHESFTYLNFKDFEVVFTIDEMTGAAITCYMMYLFEEIKNGLRKDHGFCFVSPSAISLAGRKAKFKNSDEASRSIAGRLSKRKENDIILVPYNPGRHWVLAVIDMKATTCYYLDSLKFSTINQQQLRQIIDAAMVLYAAQSGSDKRVNLNWVNVVVPKQSGDTECGYYVCKFMKEIVDKGLEVLVKQNVGDGKQIFTDADIDDVREEWAAYASNFILP